MVTSTHRAAARAWIALVCLSACAAAHGGDNVSGTGAGGGGKTSAGSKNAGADAKGNRAGAAAPEAADAMAKAAGCMIERESSTILIFVTDKLDMLFVVDNSDAMGEEQAKLRAAFPGLMRTLVTGDLDGDGKTDRPAIRDLHLGVVTTDMGLPGVQGINNCNGLGQDGILQPKPAVPVEGCRANYPPFLEFAGMTDVNQLARDLACVANVWTGGCGFEAPLEAALKALWPSVDPMPIANGMNRLQFRVDPFSAKGVLGHGDVENAGFLRNDPSDGLSRIAVVVLTDEDDCSMADTRPFTPPQFLDPSDPIAAQAMNLRCYFNKAALYPIERYVNGLRALRPGQEDMVTFAAIAGVPAALVDLPRVGLDLDDSQQRQKFYDQILAAPDMQERINELGTPNDPTDDKLEHSCNGANGGTADPPRRIVQVAQGFGAQGIVQSICAEDFAPALAAIADVNARRASAACLHHAFVRNSAGTVSCTMRWELPAPHTGLADVPNDCGGSRPWLLPPLAGEAKTNANGGANCRVAQLAVRSGPRGLEAVGGDSDDQRFDDGWYYDDFSDDVLNSCVGTGQGRQRISFTAAARPAPGVIVKLECTTSHPIVAARKDVVTMPAQPTIGSACQDPDAPAQGDKACAVHLLKASAKWADAVDRSLFCHPYTNECVLACSSDSDCPSGAKCDDSARTLSQTVRPGHVNGTPICSNPSCPVGG